ncbi:MAG: intradiol ring-cleavage dioxygenase [Chloroflexota bacterium]
MTSLHPRVDTGEVRDLSGDRLTQEVLSRFEATPSPRLREVLQALVRHVHAFARDVQLTEDEWAAAIDFLTRTGHTCTETRQEFILLSDVLGLSMQVIGINHPSTGGSTESTVFGPFYVNRAPEHQNGDDLANGAVGEPCLVSGTVRSTRGELLPARMEIWQADSEGLYDVQRPELKDAQGRGNLNAASDGRYWFWTVKPEPYPIPEDGPVGQLMHAAERSPMRPGHVHFRVSMPGYQTVTTHVFVAGDPHLDDDAVFGVKQSLIAEFRRNEPGRAADGTDQQAPYYTMRYDFVLAPEP